MSDTREKKSAEVHTPGRATAGTAAAGTAAQARETGQVSEAAAEQAGHTSADALRQGGHAAAQTAQHSGEAAAETMHHFGKVAEGATRRGTQLFADRQQQFMQSMADQLEQTGQRVTEAVQVMAQDIRTLMVLPNVVGGNLQDLQQGMGGLAERVIQTNLDAAQELLRLADVGALVRLQQRAVHNYMDAFIQGSAILTRSVRTAADRTLGPLEQQLEYRRQGRAEGQRHDRQNGRVVPSPPA